MQHLLEFLYQLTRTPMPVACHMASISIHASLRVPEKLGVLRLGHRIYTVTMSGNASLAKFHSPPSLKRWLIVLTASVFVHLAVLHWASGNLVFRLPEPAAEPVVTAQLRYASELKPEPAAVKPPRKKAAPNRRRPKPLPKPVEISAPAPSAAPELSKDMPEEIQAADSVSEPPTPHLANGIEQENENAGDLALNLPPAAELRYDVHAQKKGLSYYGSGIITWQPNGNQYLITGKAKAAFFTVLEFKSEGDIDASGIAPVLYAERAGNRSETNTHFHRERNTISFSASRLSYPRVGGEQDRASIIWQLASLGRSNPELFKPGEELYIFVAGVRNAAPWRIYILDQEEVQLDGTVVKSWHVKSVPQQGGYEKTFDIWFASGYEWYPVKLRQTEVSGDYLELTLSNLVLAQH